MNYGSSLHKKEESFDNVCVSNLPSLPWNITSKVHKIRKNVETKVKLSSVHRETVASTLREKPWPPRKAAAAAAAAAAILCPYIRERSPITQTERSFERTESGIQFLDVGGAEKRSFETLIFKYVYFDTMMNVQEKKRE